MQEQLKESNQPDNELNSELVFFDTFSHDSTEETNLDLVQFKNPVIIKEIRIIPLGAKVEADFPNGWRLGATNPSSFNVLFYINDLSKSSINKFTKFGDFQYKESVNIKFVPDELKPTNSLVLKGKYTILTLAVFAEVVDENSIRTDEELLKSQKENEQQNHQFITQLDQETDTIHSIDESACSSKVAELERVNGKEVQEIKLIDEDVNDRIREIQPISSPTNDNQEDFDYLDDYTTTKHHLVPINDSNESISSIEDKNVTNKMDTCVNDSDFEPISPDQAVNDEQVDQQSSDQQQINEASGDLMYISNLTEKVSDDEMCDFNNDFEINENSMNQRIESRTSTNSEDLEAISSEEEYFEDVAGGSNGDNEIFVDYSDDEINQINYKHDFNPHDYECRSLRSLNNPSMTAYENKRITTSNQQSVKEIFYYDKQDKNSKWIEFIENLDLNLLDLDDPALVKILIEWAKIGIDFELALNQKNTAFKVRHLKAGLKLLCSMVQTTSSIVNQLLEERILETIYKLFFKPYMTFPIKILLIRTLDIFTDNAIVLEHILNNKYNLDDEFNESLKENLRSTLDTNEERNQEEEDKLNDFLSQLKQNLDQVFDCKEKTIYQLLLILMMRSTETRVTIALTILLRKVHFYESLLNFKQIVHQQQSSIIINSLNEITKSFSMCENLFGQRIRYLPAKTQFEIKPPLSNVTYAIYRWFNHLDFLNLIIDLLSSTSDQPVVDSILNFLNEISNQQLGTAHYLSSNIYRTTNRLLEIIKSKSSQNDDDKLNKFNLTFKHNLYILELIDQINEIQSSDGFKLQNDETQLCLLYNKLYSMIFSELGSKCLIKQLCDSRNLEILIRFLIFNKERSNEKSKMISFHYAINLLIYTIQHSKERLCELLIKFYDEFINLSSYSSTLSKWLSPLKRGVKFNYSEATFKLLVSNLKQHSERLKDLKENCTYRVPSDLVCCVQILHHLCIDPNEKFSTSNQLLSNNELKYKYGLIQLFTHKGNTYILTIIERLSDIFLKPSHLNTSLIGNQGHLLISLFKPCIDILKHTLLNLMHCRGSDFKDTSTIVPLLKVYSLMLIFPLQSSYHSNSVQICNDVIAILHNYTQLNVNINEVEDEVFNKSIWTKMVKEVINFTTLKPFNFSHGLYLLSQLLPLPMSVKQTDDPNEIARLLNFRKLWSAHIHVLFSDIENMLQKLVLCQSLLIQCLLRRVCYQLIDLSSHSGVIISKCLLSVLDQHIANTTELNDDLMSVLDLISYLLKYNLFRNAFICTVNTLNSSIKKDERLDKTIRKAIEMFKSNQELSKSYSSILTVLDTKKELTTDEQLTDLTQMEKLNLFYNNREDSVQIEDDLNDNDLIKLNLNKRLVSYDLIALSKKYFDPTFDAYNQLMVIYKNEEPIHEENYKANSKHKHEPLITKDYSGNLKRPYVAPLRGRGFQRGSNSLGRVHDPFRSRPPNTSRPASLHVDDFVALENSQQQNNIKRQKQDFNKFNRINQQGQRTNLRPVYYNYRQPNPRLNIISNRNTFNRYGNIQANYNNNLANNPSNKMRNVKQNIG